MTKRTIITAILTLNLLIATSASAIGSQQKPPQTQIGTQNLATVLHIGSQQKPPTAP